MSFPGGGGIFEVPVAIASLAGFKLSVAGGGYFRLLPTAVLDRAIRSMIAERRPVILYCHPYEWTPTEMSEYRGRVKPSLAFTQSLGRGAFIRRMRHFFSRLRFGRFDQAIAGWQTRLP